MMALACSFAKELKKLGDSILNAARAPFRNQHCVEPAKAAGERSAY
jgi:hypothetical protein